MKRLFFCLSALLFVGCMPSEPEISASQLARTPENQTRHYRPVHRMHPDWSISELGKTLTVRSESNIKLSARRNPDRVIIRENGTIIGRIEHTHTGAHYVSAQIGPQQPIEFHCLSHHEAEFRARDRIDNYQLTATGASNDSFELTKLSARHRYSIVPRSAHDAHVYACDGTELESPFSSFGTLIFHADDLPLPPRAALAWYLTYFEQNCE